MPSSTSQATRQRNRDLVLREIVASRSASRSQIAARTGLTGAAVSRITRELIDIGLVREGEPLKVKGQVGRRNIHLEVDGGGAYVVGIALTANVQSLCIGNSRGEIVAERQMRDMRLDDPAKVARQMTAQLPGLIAEAGVDAGRILGCGIAVGGVADPESGVLIRSDPLRWRDVPLADYFARYLDMPVRLEGRAVALLLAEQKVAGPEAPRNVVLISNGLWVGGAMLLDDRVVKGQSNMIGQIGHFAIPGNPARCACGRRGCLDAVASGLAVLRGLDDIDLPAEIRALAPGRRLRHLARPGTVLPAAAARVYREAGRQMGHAVDALLAMLDPEEILLSGATHRHPEYIRGIRDTLIRLRPSESDWPVRVSEVTSEQSAIWLGLNNFVFSPALDVERLRRIAR